MVLSTWNVDCRNGHEILLWKDERKETYNREKRQMHKKNSYLKFWIKFQWAEKQIESTTFVDFFRYSSHSHQSIIATIYALSFVRNYSEHLSFISYNAIQLNVWHEMTAAYRNCRMISIWQIVWVPIFFYCYAILVYYFCIGTHTAFIDNNCYLMIFRSLFVVFLHKTWACWYVDGVGAIACFERFLPTINYTIN